MAGHKMSGYVASLRQALFASFIQLFNRLFPFASASTAEKAPPKSTQKEQQQPPSNPPNPSNPSNLSNQSNPSNLSTLSTLSTTFPTSTTLTTPIAKNKNTNTSYYTRSSPFLRHSPHGPCSHDSKHPFIDLEQGINPSSDLISSSQGEDTMAPSKKRGRKRGGPKSNGNGGGNGIGNGNSSTPSNGPSDAIVQSTLDRPIAPHPASQDSGPVRVTLSANQGDTTANSYQHSGQQSSGAGGGRLNDHLLSQQTPPSRSENALHTKYAGASSSQPSALEPLMTENQAQVQRSGSRIQQAATVPDPAPNRPAMAENIPPSKPAEHRGSDINPNTTNGFSHALQPPQPSQAAVPAPVKTVVIPRPTVALPLTDKNALKSVMPASPVSTVPNHLPGLIEPKTEEERIERAHHLKYMRAALDMGNLALSTNETPVGCVIVYHGRIIARGMNATNNTRNGTRHAEFMAVSALLSRKGVDNVQDIDQSPALDDACWGDVDPSDGHLYPYGQKLHPAPVVNRAILSECILYVTVEPCVMCASLLRQLGIKKVYFGAVNDKFGGTGGVFRIHMNSKPVSKPKDRPYQYGYGPQDASRVVKGRASLVPRDMDDGDGGNVEHGYTVEGGYLRDDAVSLLRRFYVQENGRAPQPRKKEGRAARLYAMENEGKMEGDGSDVAVDPDEEAEIQEDLFGGEENIEAAYIPTEV
ncbi:cytidine deaminase-like protein [Rostrohypoxylon terebratum]|nr:cytidine deaminase-like protein [Rostrohypoxylon terebratum]